MPSSSFTGGGMRHKAARFEESISYFGPRRESHPTQVRPNGTGDSKIAPWCLWWEAEVVNGQAKLSQYVGHGHKFSPLKNAALRLGRSTISSLAWLLSRTGWYLRFTLAATVPNPA
jgi:hypothetical protein